MTTVTEIQEAIRNLPRADFVQLMRWLDEHDWDVWDSEIEADSDGGRLGFLINEAAKAKRQGKLFLSRQGNGSETPLRPPLDSGLRRKDGGHAQVSVNGGG